MEFFFDKNGECRIGPESAKAPAPAGRKKENIGIGRGRYEKRAGKAAADAYLVPVRRRTKRGRFLQWLLEQKRPPTVVAIMNNFSMTRANVTASLRWLNLLHGIGYAIKNQTVYIELPKEGALWE